MSKSFERKVMKKNGDKYLYKAISVINGNKIQYKKLKIDFLLSEICWQHDMSRSIFSPG